MPKRIRAGKPYWLLERRGADSPALAAVRDWILAEAESARAAMG